MQSPATSPTVSAKDHARRSRIYALTKKWTPRQIRSFLVRLGQFYVEEKKPAFDSQMAAFHTLKSLGWTPTHCIDVGAYHGKWSRACRSVFPDAGVLMIEAQEGKQGILNEVVSEFPHKLACEIALLGASDGTEVEFVEMRTGSSVLEESSYFPRQKKKSTLTRLDTLLKKHPAFDRAQLLKLDTQGYEIEILKGAPNLLQQVQVVLLEASLIPVNKGAPLFSEVVEFMSDCSFKLFDVTSQVRRKDRVLWQTDLLFVREGTLPNLKPELTKENWG